MARYVKYKALNLNVCATLNLNVVQAKCFENTGEEGNFSNQKGGMQTLTEALLYQTLYVVF